MHNSKKYQIFMILYFLNYNKIFFMLHLAVSIEIDDNYVNVSNII